jgi:hypothetical protein
MLGRMESGDGYETGEEKLDATYFETPNERLRKLCEMSW